MKKIILNLLLAQTIATTTALFSNAGVYTLLAIYAVQNLLLVVITFIEGMRYSSGMLKIIHLAQSVINLVISLGLIAFVIILKLPGPVTVNGVPTVISIGELSVPALIIGSLGFLIEYIREARFRRSQSQNHALVRYTRSFFIIYLNMAALLLIIFIALLFNRQTDYTLVAIALIKTTLDIGLLFLERALTHINIQMKHFKFPGFGL